MERGSSQARGAAKSPATRSQPYAGLHGLVNLDEFVTVELRIDPLIRARAKQTMISKIDKHKTLQKKQQRRFGSFEG